MIDSVNIVFLDRDTIAPQIQINRPDIKCSWQEYPKTNAADVVKRLKEADIVLNNKVKLTAEVLQQLPNLKMIALTATGYDCVDIDYCHAHNILVSNIRGYAKHTVPEHTFTLLLALRRNLLAYREDVMNGVWECSEQFCFFDHSIKDLVNSTLVIVGSGSLGQGVATVARGFGMRVIFAARKGQTNFDTSQYTAWEQAIATADVISLHCPLNNETKHMIAQAEFKAMKPEAILLNTARGGLVNEVDLVEAIEQGAIAGAGFDVSEIEPLPSNSPLKKIILRPDFILTPHIAWASDEAQQTLINQAIENIELFVKGQPRNSL